MPTRAHHTAILTADFEASTRFYREGLGLELLMDQVFDGDWTTLFGAPVDKLRSIFLGDPADASAGIVELVQFVDNPPDGGPAEAGGRGFFLLSFFVPLEETIARLESLGFPIESQIETVGRNGPVGMATLRDPDGVLIELIAA